MSSVTLFDSFLTLYWSANVVATNSRVFEQLPVFSPCGQNPFGPSFLLFLWKPIESKPFWFHMSISARLNDAEQNGRDWYILQLCRWKGCPPPPMCGPRTACPPSLVPRPHTLKNSGLVSTVHTCVNKLLNVREKGQ